MSPREWALFTSRIGGLLLPLVPSGMPPDFQSVSLPPPCLLAPWASRGRGSGWCSIGPAWGGCGRLAGWKLWEQAAAACSLRPGADSACHLPVRAHPGGCRCGLCSVRGSVCPGEGSSADTPGMEVWLVDFRDKTLRGPSNPSCPGLVDFVQEKRHFDNVESSGS